MAAKHGVVGLTKVVALETAGSGITCNSICPAWVLTPLVQKQIDARAAALGGDQEAAIRQMMQSQPSGEFVTPEQIAGLVLFLCSGAAAQITGAAITIDGGWTAQLKKARAVNLIHQSLIGAGAYSVSGTGSHAAVP